MSQILDADVQVADLNARRPGGHTYETQSEGRES